MAEPDVVPDQPTAQGASLGIQCWFRVGWGWIEPQELLQAGGERAVCRPPPTPDRSVPLRQEVGQGIGHGCEQGRS